MTSTTRHLTPSSLVGPAAAALVLCESARQARNLRVGRCEERVFRRFNGAPDSLHVPLWVVMQSGSLAAVWVTGGALVRAGRTPSACVTTLVGSAVWGGVKLIKPRVGRGRPEALLDGVSVRGHAQTGLGYPSGHAAVAATLALAVSHTTGPTWRVAAIAVAATVGGARMYVGAHLPLDVAGGLAIGVLFGRAARAISNEWS